MDEWVINGKEVPESHPLSFARANKELFFNLIWPKLKIPEEIFTFQNVLLWKPFLKVLMRSSA